MLPRLLKITGQAYDFLFPRRCVGCGREGAFICSACRSRFAPIEPPVCSLCGVPVSNGPLCPSCSGWKAAIDCIRSAFRFEGPAREAVHQLKYQNLRAIAPDLASLMLPVINSLETPSDVFVPVPLHPRRLRERGYNQSALLARELGRLTGLPVDETCLVRQRNTRSQARTGSVTERRENMEAAFTCVNQDLKGRRVILVGDVATSGATLNAGAAALKDAGALSVCGITFAREV